MHGGIDHAKYPRVGYGRANRGDEFVLLLPDTEAEGAPAILSALKNQLVEEAEQGGWPVTFSIGAATFVEPPDSVDDMIRIADRLMYAAKNSGKNAIRHEVFRGLIGEENTVPADRGSAA